MNLPPVESSHGTRVFPSPFSPAGLQFSWRQKGLVLLCTVVGLALGAGYYLWRPPSYLSRAEVAVQSRRSDLLTGANPQNDNREDYVAAQMARLRSPVLVEQAVQRGKLDLLPSLAGRANPTTDILESLQIDRGRSQFGENNLLQVSIRARFPDDCGTILTALLDAHRHSVEVAYEAEANQALQAILQARNYVQKQLMAAEKAYTTFRKQFPLAEKGPTGLSPLRQRLDAIQARRSTLLVRRTGLQTRLDALLAAQKTNRRPAWLLNELSASADGDSANPGGRDRALAMAEQLAPLQQEMERLLANYGPNHPDVEAARKRMDAVRALFLTPASAWNDGRSAPLNALDRLLAENLSLTRERLQEANSADQKLAVEEKAIAGQLADVAARDDEYRSNLARLQQLYDNIIKRVQEVRLATEVGGYDIQVISPPSKPEKVAPSARLILPAGMLLGFLGGLGLAYRTGNKGRRAEDVAGVSAHLGVPLLGSVPWITRSGAVNSALDPLLCVLHRPYSAEAEAFRVIRTALYYGPTQSEQQVLQITSPRRQDGKSTLAANLALAIAQTGKQVVLVDANLRTPQLGSFFGLGAGPGLADVLSGDAEPVDALQACAVPGLSVLPAGRVTANPAELLSSPRFAELLHWLRERADFVLVDSPALADVADAAVIAARVDGILLALRLRQPTVAEIEQGIGSLEAVGGRLRGMIVNAADPHAGLRLRIRLNGSAGEVVSVSTASTETRMENRDSIVQPISNGTA